MVALHVFIGNMELVELAQHCHEILDKICDQVRLVYLVFERSTSSTSFVISLVLEALLAESMVARLDDRRADRNLVANTARKV